MLKELQLVVGAWKKTDNMTYKSSSSLLSDELTILDHHKDYSTMWIGQNNLQTVFWNRLLKRTDSYLGADEDNDESHWTIIGDHHRFIFVIAYKQNSTTHSRILAFGDFTDLKTDTIKTMLIGYNTNQIADVGFNKLFEYLDGHYSDKGELMLNNTDNNQASGIGWIYSNKNGNVDYLHGVKDCGQHVYPIPI